MTVVRINECQNPRFNREDKCLLGFLLSIRHISMSSAGVTGTYMTSTTSRFAQGNTANQHQRFGNQIARPYDRMYTFADLKYGGGKCLLPLLRMV